MAPRWSLRDRGLRPALDAPWARVCGRSVLVRRQARAKAGPYAEWQTGFAASAGLGSLLGIRHALEPDHLAAVSTLVTGERSSAKAAWLGACWGLGHTLTLLAAAVVLVVLRADMPAAASDVFEFGVVLLLVGFGVRAIYQGA